MEKTIRNREELRDAYIFVQLYQEALAEGKVKNVEGAKKLVIEYKKAIRAYNKSKSNIRYIGGDYDYYTVLIEFSQGMTMEEAESCFENEYRLIAYPSSYDCTGQHFTTRYKFVERRGRIYCYHTIAVDV